MPGSAAITILRPVEETRRLWQQSEQRPSDIGPDVVTMKEAPGDRGTEIYIETPDGGIFGRLRGSARRAKAMDALRRFKQEVETGVITRSDGAPEGELTERKLKQRPAQPLSDAERAKAGI